ncbi:adhesion domain-containing protein, partial [Yersinia bercovieri]
FTVITSPDSTLAKYWGHMDETITAAGVTFKRPLLAAEAASGQGSEELNNEQWNVPSHNDAMQTCVNNLPTKTELDALYIAGGVNSHGWPNGTGYYYWSITSAPAGFYGINMNNGQAFGLVATDGQLVSCL